MEKEKIAELFMKGIDCSQVVAGAFAEELGITQEEAYKMAAGFGGGMGIGENLRCSSWCNDRTGTEIWTL
ncbi:MAG: C-GCAxxG-C-C family (seleno)protein [Dorea sp.]